MRHVFKRSTLLFITVFPLLCILLTYTNAMAYQNNTAEENKHIMFLKPGGSQIMQIDNVGKNIKVFISESDVVHARPLKEDQIYIRGKKAGYCTVTIWDNIKKEATAEIDVTVSYDLTGLKKQIAIHFPNQDIQVYGADNGIVLSGTVTGPEIVEQAIRLAERFLPTHRGTSHAAAGQGGMAVAAGSSSDDDDDGEDMSTGKTRATTTKITNLLTVSNIQQVMLEVKFAEVSREESMNWSAGVSYFDVNSDYGGIIGAPRVGDDGGLDLDYPDGIEDTAGSIITNFVGDAANILLKIDDFGVALEFLEGEGLAKVLAEPRLVALSGQEASFLAGSKFPYTTSTLDQNGNAVTTVQYEPLGISLKFTPIVQSNGLITLKVAPKIAELDTQNPTVTTGSEDLLPFVVTRQLETSAQLRDGQTLVLAGLLSDKMVDTVNKVPMLGDIPILGALFKSLAYQNKKSELMISITPHLVAPTKEGLISYPGEFIKPPDRFEFYLMGKLEGDRTPEDPTNISEHNFSLQHSGGLEGSFGHIEQ